MSNEAWSSKLPALPVQELLEILVGLEKAGKNPPVAALLHAGHTLTGWVVATESKNSRMNVVLAGIESHGRRSSQVTYFDAGMIVALSVLQAESVKLQLGRGKIDPLDDQEAPGRLQVTRRMGELSAELSRAFGKDLKIEVGGSADQPRRLAAAAELAQLVEQVLTELSKDSFCRDAVTAKVQRMTLEHGGTQEFRLEGQVLTISSPLDGNVSERFSLSELKSAFNRIL